MNAPRALTEHAIKRYRQRVRRGARVREIVEALEGGEFRTTAPGRMLIGPNARDAAGYIVAGEAVFPVKRNPQGELVAVTCLRRHTVSKAERRARRAEARDEYAA